MLNEKIIDKIQKLMELADSANEHEASLAAERAAELMAKHQISMLDVQARTRPDEKPGVEEGRIDSDDANAPPARIENWHKSLLVSVAEAFGGRGWMHGKGRYQQFRMAGPVDSVASARYMYLSLERQINRFARAATRARDESNAWRRSYACGMVAKVYQRLKAGRAAAVNASGSLALVLVDKQKLAVDAYYATLGEMKQSKQGARKRADATGWGYADGDKVDVGANDRSRLGVGQKKLPS